MLNILVQDVRAMRTEMGAMRAEMRTEMRAMRTEMDRRFGTIEQSLATLIAAVPPRDPA
jgi:hypothetical protein